MNKKETFRLLCFSAFILFLASFVSAGYTSDVYFSVSDTVYSPNESIYLKGGVYRGNFSSNGTEVSASSLFAGATVNLTIRNSSEVVVSNHTFTTDSAGEFYSKSAAYPNARNVSAPGVSGEYTIRAQYTDPENTTWFSEVSIYVVNQTLDILAVSTDKAVYSQGETIYILGEAIRQVGDRVLLLSGASINGSVRNSTKAILSTFNCTTGTSGSCTVSTTAASTYGSYFVELNDFSTYNSFTVIPFIANMYMKDELAKSSKNIYAIGEQATVEVNLNNASSTERYTFSGYIMDSSGNVVKTINSTTLNSNNSFTNSFLFTVDAITFSYGAYTASVTVSKSGGSSSTITTSFEVNDWALSFDKRAIGSGFEYEYSSFPNSTVKFDVSPAYRVNGSIIPNINESFFTVRLKDSLSTELASANISWNSSCGSAGCYQFSIQTPSQAGSYDLSVSLSYNGAVQTKKRVVNVISGVMSAQPTNSDGALKELFGTNEFVYLSLSAYNTTLTQLNLSNAEIFSIVYMNGTELNYTQVADASLVNLTNNYSEWAWNSSAQHIKMDVPKVGGMYTIVLFGDNKTMATNARFIVNPYDACIVTKDTSGTVSSGYYYVWQFKKTDTVYFEIKAVQANNPLGRASVMNSSNSNSTGSAYGKGSACGVDTTTKQVISNATISVLEVRNTESGALQNVNASQTNCQSSDNSGGYTCTVKPLNSWEGGVNVASFRIVGADGTEGVAFGRFESRAFYMYGWSSVWQNNPNSNITLNVNIYEAGKGWWGSSGGLSGTVSVKRVEYQGRDGEWIWPPVDSGYNVSALNSSSLTGGTGSVSLKVANIPGGRWKTGNYRVVLQGTTSSGDSDYGYAWFGVKLWDVYGQPVECTTTGCSYKSYFNSKENITMYIKISSAGNNYNYNENGGTSLGGNVSIGVKSIQDCRSWPCKEMNTSNYQASTIIVNDSSPWYWNANIQNNSNYLLQINTTLGTWSTGYYSVILDINGTDTGYAWFNTIAFYVETSPTNENGSNHVYSIRGNSPMYFNVTAVSSFKSGYWSGGNYYQYNASDYVNVTVRDVVLRTWDQTTWQSKEYNYPEDINVTPLTFTGNTLLNFSYNSGSWSTGYYWGEVTLANSDNETSSGWLWFNVQPFRVEISTNSYNVDSESCVNGTISIYEPSWYSNSPLLGNYSIVSVSETSWSGMSQTITDYTNYTPSSSQNFNATTVVSICPNSGTWGSGSWGGYHYLNVIVKDNVANDTQTGWISFRAVPFSVSWGSIVGGTSKLTNNNLSIPVTLTNSLTGANATGNLTKIYQWRYDSDYNGQQDYVFSVGSCYSNVSSSCNVNGSSTVIVYPPAGGWKLGYNYLYAEWTKSDDSSYMVQDWSGIYFEGREAYNGYFNNQDVNGWWAYYFNQTENITIQLNVRDSSYNAINVNISSLQYAYSATGCWSEWCRTYTDATWSVHGGGIQTSAGSALLQIKAPSSGWDRGYYYIKAGISGSSGTATITGGTVRVKDKTAPNITIVAPANNFTANTSTMSFNATTSENAQCSLSLANFDNFYGWYCGGIIAFNSSNGTSAAPSQQSVGACNVTKYAYNGTRYLASYISSNYYSVYNNTDYLWTSASGTMTTGGTVHSYIFNLTTFPSQHYGVNVWCYDDEDNYAQEKFTFRANITGT